MDSDALFVGDGTLLIRCAEVFRARGGRIAGIATSAPHIAAWAVAENIALFQATISSLEALPRADFLFSIANLMPLSGSVLLKAHRIAVNFHDGPLPARAGLNVTSWAILEGAKEHAVTWHEMTEHVDAGRVLVERRFALRGDETAFTLNARCYEAGLESFHVLVDDLAAGRSPSLPQSGARRLYRRAERPDLLGTLDFSRPVDELERMVRALNFGTYANPLALAKIWTGTTLAKVATTETAAGAGEPAGTVLSVDSQSMTVAAGSGALHLSGLSEISGVPFDPRAAGLRPGSVLPRPDFPDAPSPADIGRGEAVWRAELERTSAALPPYPRDYQAASEQEVLDIKALDADALAAAWLAWVGGLVGQEDHTLAFVGSVPEAAPWISPLRAVTVSLGENATPADLISAVASAHSAAVARAPMAVDLPYRLGDSELQDRAIAALGVVVTDSPRLPRGVDLALSIGPPRLTQRAGLFGAKTFAALARDFAAFAGAFLARQDELLHELPLGQSTQVSECVGPPSDPRTVHQVIADVSQLTPDSIALEAGEERLSYAELDKRAAALAGALSARGAAPDTVVGLCLERSADLVVAMLAILKTGAAYVPLDPDYPAERIAFMLADSSAPLVVASRSTAARLELDPARLVFPDAAAPPQAMRGGPDDLAYLIYTSGSTGRPKGVMIRHRNVTNFFAGMDATIPFDAGARLLAVTSVSFDISVLEILWTLARGSTVVLQTDRDANKARPEFSLFYFASEASGVGHHAYRLLLEGARFADENGFEAIWTPERHFHAFGGLYPNPAISSAALAGITRNVKLRAGSSVVPLHHPVQVAEDWALVDNLSNGRAGIAIAAGWQPNDFLLRPEAFEERKSIALDAVETLRSLWRGEEVTFPGHDGKPVPIVIHPRPVQPEIPLWLTAAGNPETFEAAGRMGCGVLTHLLGQTFEEVEEKIRSYRAARAEAGHAGPGHVVLMLHTFVGENEEAVLAAAREPMKDYLKSAVDLVRRAAWTFPTIVERASNAGVTPQALFEEQDLSAEELDALLEYAFERYYRTAGLFGTPDSAREIVHNVASMGVDEIACLIDFGIKPDLVLKNLPNIRTLMTGIEQAGGVSRKASVAEDILTHEITHLQCTPSMAYFLAADTAGRRALDRLQCLMVGGEALPPELAGNLRAAMQGALFNMYGPTETTIWSSVARLDWVGDKVPIGGPVANTTLSVRSAGGRPLPDLVEGELWIGGAGVAKGYWNRADLTAERFCETPEGRYYRTGDLVRRHPDGTYEFLGRIDGQVKIRGHRVEVGEIEAILAADPSVREAVVVAREFGAADLRLMAYVTAGGAAVQKDKLRNALASQLPDYMLPADIIELERMPLTANGKIDRKALPTPGGKAAKVSAAAAEGDLETAIAAIWGEALGLEQVSVTQNFFDMGGHSLLAVQVQRRMQEKLGREIAITDLFRFPTVRAIATHLSASAPDRPTASDRGSMRAAQRRARFGRR